MRRETTKRPTGIGLGGEDSAIVGVEASPKGCTEGLGPKVGVAVATNVNPNTLGRSFAIEVEVAVGIDGAAEAAIAGELPEPTLVDRGSNQVLFDASIITP